MNLYAALRKWHINIGLAVALPLITVGVTAVMMAHNQALDLRNIPVNAGWLPGYGLGKNKTSVTASDLEIRSILTTHAGRYLIGTRYGLYELSGHSLRRIESLPGKEIFSIKETPNGILCAGRSGVWLSNGQIWKRLFKGEALDAELNATGRIRIVTRRKGLMESADDGRHWEPVAAINAIPAEIPGTLQQEELTLGRLALDLHTGRAFLGKDWAWLWIDLVAFSLGLLSLSGIVMWTRKKPKPRPMPLSELKAVPQNEPQPV